jgi:hypothetical protein
MGIFAVIPASYQDIGLFHYVETFPIIVDSYIMNNYGADDPQNDKRQQKNSGPQFPFGGGGPKLPDLKPSWKFSLIYILILIIGLSLFNFVFLRRVNPAIDFFFFLTKIASERLEGWSLAILTLLVIPLPSGVKALQIQYSGIPT